MDEIKDYELPDVILVSGESKRECLSLNIMELFAAGELFLHANDGKVYRVDLMSFWHDDNIMSVYKDAFGSVMFDEDGDTVLSVPSQSMDDIRKQNDDLKA